jgi:Tol biopolymer transport system component
VNYADWTPDGKDLLIVRVAANKCRLEFPAGKVLYETTGWAGNPRFSPKGDRIAFIDHPIVFDDGGSVAVVDLTGKKTAISPGYATAQGLAWSPDGSEVWYTAAEVGGNRSLHAATLSGKTRTLARVSGNLTLHDVARDGRVLMDHDTNQVGVIARAAGATKETDLTWLDWSLLSDISADGRFVLFTETGEGGGRGYSVYIRALDGSPAVRLGEGNGQSISPDGKRVIALVGPPQSPDIVIYPTGAGEAKKIPASGLVVRNVRWMPDGKRILAIGREAAHPTRTYLFDGEGGAPRVLTPEGYRGNIVSPDGKRFLTFGPDQRTFSFSIDGGEPTPISGIGPTDGIGAGRRTGVCTSVRAMPRASRR